MFDAREIRSNVHILMCLILIWARIKLNSRMKFSIMMVPHYPNKPSLRVNWLSRQVFRLNARQIPNSRLFEVKFPKATEKPSRYWIKVKNSSYSRLGSGGIIRAYLDLYSVSDFFCANSAQQG